VRRQVHLKRELHPLHVDEARHLPPEDGPHSQVGRRQDGGPEAGLRTQAYYMGERQLGLGLRLSE
jgi:hypothetical protein